MSRLLHVRAHRESVGIAEYSFEMRGIKDRSCLSQECTLGRREMALPGHVRLGNGSQTLGQRPRQMKSDAKRSHGACCEQ